MNPVADVVAPSSPDPVWMTDYLGWLASQRRAAALTLENYTRDLRKLQRLAEGRDPVTLTSAEIRRFAGRLHGEGLGPRSIARCLSAWRSLFRWLVRHRGLKHNPVEGIRPPKAPSKLPGVLSPDQAACLLDAAPAESVLDLRDLAMFELFYSSGLRLSELTSLMLDGSLDLVEGMVTVKGKRGKTRTVPVGSRALAALRAWLDSRSQLPIGDNLAVFVTRTGACMSPGAVRSRLALRAQQSGLGMHAHPHMLRHSFASHLLQSSGDLRAVQELLGHASIRSTQVYTHLDFQHLAKVYDAAHPRAKR